MVHQLNLESKHLKTAGADPREMREIYFCGLDAVQTILLLFLLIITRDIQLDLE